jgi:hypothetical protein
MSRDANKVWHYETTDGKKWEIKLPGWHDILEDVKGADVWNQFDGTNPWNIVFLDSAWHGGKGYWQGLNMQTEEGKLFAQKMIWGSDYDTGANFGANNVHMLLHDAEKIKFETVEDDGGIIGYNINTTAAGHISWNPNVPGGKQKKDLEPYIPALQLRHTKSMYWGKKLNGKNTLILGARYLVMPKGSVTGQEVK